MRREGRGVLHVTHSISDAAKADRVVVLQSGAVVFDGPPEELLRDHDRVRALGLVVPPTAVFAEGLRGFGVPVPVTALDAASVLEALWPSG